MCKKKFPPQNSEEQISCEDFSDQDYIPDSLDSSEESTVSLQLEHPKQISNKQNVSCIESTGEIKNGRQCQEMEVEAERAEPGRTRVLSLATMSNATLCQPISQGVWKLLTVMKDDNITAAVRSDFCILQLAQSFFNKHGQDPTKFEYIRQKLREVGRLLLILQREFKIQTLEDATPSLALKLGHSLQKICDIVHCRALMAEDTEGIRSTQTFQKLYSTKWAELISHTALITLSEAHFNKPSTIPFTEDVQCLHRHLEKVADSASENLKKKQSAQAYGELSRATLRVEIRGKRGRKVAVLLSPDVVDALTHLVRSTQLRKHVATLSQVLNLKNHELDQVADFLGHDIRVHREYYRLPEATTQLAKISKLLLALEKGTLANLQGETLEEIEIEDNLDFTDSEQSEDSDAETYPQTITEMSKITQICKDRNIKYNIFTSTI
ncbi:hypothetical protein PO909_026768 [Leuciscus waleckii]